MEIRKAVREDIPAIVELLKASLGESLMPKSEQFWNWKHVDNPFGESFVLVSVDGGKLSGVRAFMQWRWRDAERIYRAVRAVDTATHPDFQGKGIFSKLTLQLVEQCKDEGVDFIFNTPNKKSGPGYLKMGWSALGKFPMHMDPFAGRLFSSGEISVEENLSSFFSKYSSEVEGLIQSKSTALVTLKTLPYLIWRYATNPNLNYKVLYRFDEHPFVVIYRVKENSWGRELRVVDLLANGKGGRLGNQLGALRKREGARVVTISCDMGYRPLFNPFALRVGPLVTVRNLNLSNQQELLTFDRWKPSLGDLEVF